MLPGIMTDITLTHEPLDLPLSTVWRISRGSRTRAENVLVRLSWVDPAGRVWEGHGEAAPYGYYGELRGTVTACLDEFATLLGDDPFDIGAILGRIESRVRHNTSAKAAVDMALHDLWGKILGRPVWQAWGLDASQGPVTSYSIGIDTPEAMGKRARALAEAGWPLIKLKVGTHDDIRCVSAVREAAPSVRLIIDANGAWNPREAITRLRELSPFDIEFCEQPCSSADVAGLRFIRERSDIALVADESCATEEDIAPLVGAVDGINIKLMKCGGLRRARRLIEVARANHLKVMCGCLIESSLAISAAAQLLPLLDYADLDGNLLLSSDPFTGVTTSHGKIVLGSGHGLGVSLRTNHTEA